MSIEDVCLFFCGWDVLSIVGEDGFVGVGFVSESIVECLDPAPYLGWVGSEVYFVQGVFPEGVLLLSDVVAYFSVQCLYSIEYVGCWWQSS